MASSGVSLQVRDLRKTYGQGAGAVHALDTVSLDIRQNEFFTLLGPSGCGKTTLLRLIAGFDHPTGGRILLEGEDIGMLPPYRRPVNTVFQNYALFPHMTVAGNIAFGLEMLRRPRAETERTVEEMLRLIRMGELGDRRTSEISGGQQQRVALARALAPRPKVLLLDEPLSALDLKLRKEMQIELKRLQHETGITFVFVTHDQEEALTMSDRLAVMSRGKVLQVGTPREIYDRPADRFVADFIGESNFLTGRLERRDGSRGTVRLDMGATIVAALPDGPLSSDDVTVVVRPEHVNLGAAGADATLAGTIETVVYFGTDTHYHLRLDGGLPFIVRAQNRRGQPVDALRESMPVGVRIEDGVAQVLRHS